MEEVVLRLEGATYRHSLYAPSAFKPWRRIRGQGIFSANLSLHKGTILGLVGPNGAGKTTLLRMMAGILPLQEGSTYDSRKDSSATLSDAYIARLATGVSDRPLLSYGAQAQYPQSMGTDSARHRSPRN